MTEYGAFLGRAGLAAAIFGALACNAILGNEKGLLATGGATRGTAGSVQAGAGGVGTSVAGGGLGTTAGIGLGGKDGATGGVAAAFGGSTSRAGTGGLTSSGGRTGTGGAAATAGTSGDAGGRGGTESSRGGIGGGAIVGGTPTTGQGGSAAEASSTGGNTGTTGGGSSGGATGTGGVATGGGSTCAPPPNLLSDFESGFGTLYPVPTAQTNGFWHSYKDATNCASAPLVPTPIASKDSGVAATLLPTTDTRYSSCNLYAMHSSITGCQTYSGFGAAMRPTPGGGIRNPVDVSGFDGITFWAKAGTGTQGALYLELLSQECLPASVGGTAVSPVIDQYNCHGKLFTSIPTTWTQFFVPFGTAGPRWFPFPSAAMGCAAGSFCEAPQLVTSHFLGFQFALEDPFNNGGVLNSYDVWIDDVALYSFSDAPANAGLGTWPQTDATNTFPQDRTFTGCTKPTGATGKLLQDAYLAWKARFVVADGANLRVISPEIDTGNPTVSEGIGYGMLMAVYMADKPLFDGLLGYWKAHPSAQSMLMTWKIGGTGGSGSASDADQDVAFALQMARRQWGSAYDTDAATILSQFLANDVDANNYLKAGNTLGGKNLINPSYFAPAFYKFFATVDAANATRWNALAANCYTQLGNISGTNGLVPAWCNSNCTIRGSGGLNFVDELLYQYDSHRMPWRIGLDQCWNGDANAVAYLDRVVGFFASASDTEGLSSLLDVYTGDGTAPASPTVYGYNSMSLVGPASAAALKPSV